MDNQSGVIHSLDTPSTMTTKTLIIMLVVALIAGVGGGFLMIKMKKSTTASSSTTQTTSGGTQKVAGIADKKTFKDSADGLLKEGGIDGEGSFHLERPGGESQNVYLTSSTVDLAQYVGKKVKVWGETFKSTKAGWLMDVGLVELQ